MKRSRDSRLTPSCEKGIKTWKIGLILFLFLPVLISNAQDLTSAVHPGYRLILKGQPSPFDSAVAINLPIYRLESEKLKLGSELIDSLGQEIRSLYQTIQISDSLYRLSQIENRALSAAYLQKDSLATSYLNLYHDADKRAQEYLNNNKRTWIEDPKTWGVGGVVIGFIIHSFISR